MANNETEKTEQEILNNSYDRDFDILAAQMIGFDGTNTVKIATTTDGKLKVTI